MALIGWYILLAVDIIAFTGIGIGFAYILDMGYIVGSFTVIMFLLLALNIFHICIGIHARLIYMSKHTENKIKKSDK